MKATFNWKPVVDSFLTDSLKKYRLFLVLGNEPHEMVSDCSGSMPEAPLEEFSAFWEGKVCPETPEAGDASLFEVETTSILIHTATLLGGKYTKQGNAETILLPCGRSVSCVRWSAGEKCWTTRTSWESGVRHFRPVNGEETPQWLAAVIRSLVVQNDEQTGLCKIKPRL